MAGNSLHERRLGLIERSTREREQLATELAMLTAPVATVDRGLATLRRWAANPVAVGLAVTALVVLARHLPMRRLGALAGLASTAWQLRQAALGGKRASAAGR
ncbi:MAG: hypothetical protein L6Q83_06425 [Gammaproteobacteria bacterium]|nr:hypothetical protein [Gammaproteobacteria bacterium]